MVYILDYPSVLAANKAFGSPIFLAEVLPGRVVVSDLLAQIEQVGGLDVVTVQEFDDYSLSDPAQDSIISSFVELSIRLAPMSAATIAWAEGNNAICIVDEPAAVKICGERTIQHRTSVDVVNKLVIEGRIDTKMASRFLSEVFATAGIETDVDDLVAEIFAKRF
jgi:hypothetical protein